MGFQPLNRRTFLRGTGACIALPFLEAMLPIRASAAVGGAPQRFVGMMFPNGVMISPTHNNWECSGSGANYTLSAAMQPLAPFKSYVSPLHNLTNGAYEKAYQMESGQSHWYAATSFLTGQPLDWRARTSIGPKLLNPGASLDQMIGNLKPTPVKPLVMGIELANGAYNDAFFGSDHIATQVSFSSQTEMPNRMDTAAQVFKYLFGGVTSQPGGGSTSGNRQSNILDLVKTDIDRLMKKLGARDKAKMDEFLTSVETLRRNVASDTPPPTGGGSCSTAPSGSAYLSDTSPTVGSLGVRAKNMMDMLVIAFQCDLTRACSLMLGNENTYIPLRSLDPSLPDLDHHGVSHYHSKDYLAVAFRQVNLWQTGQLAYLLGKLQNTSDAFGPLIENTLVLFGSGMSDGEHLTYNMDGQIVANWNKIPLILAGRGGGHRSGISYNFGRADHANLLAAIAQAYGAGSKVGNSTSPLTGLF